MIETTKYAEVTKKYPYHQQRKLSCVRNGNNHKIWSSCPTCKQNEGTDTKKKKTIIREVTENKSPAKKDTNIEIATKRNKQKNKESPKAPLLK